MKKKSNSHLILFIIIALILFFIAIFLQNNGGNIRFAYSAENKSKDGVSVFFESVQQLGYSVEVSKDLVEEHSTSDMQVVVANRNFSLEEKEVREWIEEGGRLVYLNESPYMYSTYGTLEDNGEQVKVYSYGKGKIILAEVKSFTNGDLYIKGLINEDRKEAYELFKIIEGEGPEKIYFNESYFYITSETKTLWDSLSMDQKFFCYQIILFLIAFFAYKGKRFGKPIPLYEEVERTENEYVYSAAALYKHAACWDLAAENYYKSFLRLINKSHDNWLEYWEEEQLTDIFNKRRDSYWKQWKINQ
ncbi:MAG TPA: hypothetical protein DGK91_11900 [Clostridium sp.]|nr:hypothetical protein [Clostridium sp.]